MVGPRIVESPPELISARTLAIRRRHGAKQKSLLESLLLACVNRSACWFTPAALNASRAQL